MAKIIIFGTGRGAAMAHRYFMLDSDDVICAFTVESEYLTEPVFRDLPIVDFANVESIYPPTEFEIFVPLGSQKMNKVRREKYLQCKQKGYKLASYVNSKIQFREQLQVGENCMILENNSINFDVKIGNNVTIWSSNQIGDRSIIHDHCWITSNVCIAGDVTIKESCFIGINATISNDVVIAEENFVGASALITKSTGRRDVYVVAQTPKAGLSSDKFVAMLNRSF